ncbi:hypothetical protein SAMN05216188_10318 [Lentzea xinjiangensis]|uniref:Uncharacterized protein n=1 Tax=Lentzea xinjiangensis TaxID=402600 RepID=A0A1H9FZD4_9PSEU|nr:hypothetical protein [Lentzea xinjiangensis]SEQ43201.1 hypothetical protein SAMN05216188_10318 [Lentzea xinjiangensis]
MRVLMVVAALVLGSMGATKADAVDYLDLPLVNSAGEERGGVHPDLPYDRASLEQALTAYRAQGVAPARFKALLWQYWIVRAAEDAGVRLADWDPQRGAEHNRPVIFAVYDFYAKLYLEHPGTLRWMGFANIGAPAFAAGMLDLGTVPELRWFSSMLMSMQKHIFMDLGAMHAAYLHGGIAAVQEMRDAGIIDAETTAAWAEPARAVLEFSSREQNLVIAEQFDRMRSRLLPPGEVITYAITVAGPMPVPGGRTPAQYRPLFGGPLPAFNYADREARWDFLSNDTVPAYERLSAEAVHEIVRRPFADRVAEYRARARLLDLVLPFGGGARTGVR